MKRLRTITGFTLLEVMISVAIVGVIMMLIWTSTSQSLRSKDRIEERDLVYHSARVALRKISDDLAVAFLIKKASTSELSASTSATGSQVKAFFVGENQSSQDTLKFTSLSHLRLFSGAKEADQCRIMYEVVPDEEEVGKYNLIRREDPWLDDSTDVKGKALTLVENIREFDLEYYDTRKEDWVREWNTERVDWKDRLPYAVRINLLFTDPESEDIEIPMTTSVIIALSKDPIEI